MTDDGQRDRWVIVTASGRYYLERSKDLGMSRGFMTDPETVAINVDAQEELKAAARRMIAIVAGHYGADDPMVITARRALARAEWEGE